MIELELLREILAKYKNPSQISKKDEEKVQ